VCASRDIVPGPRIRTGAHSRHVPGIDASTGAHATTAPAGGAARLGGGIAYNPGASGASASLSDCDSAPRVRIGYARPVRACTAHGDETWA